VHVLGAAFAHESPAAKSFVLLTAGWHRVPSASKGDDKIESSRWHRASIANTLAFCNMSQSNLISKGVSLEEAWEGHLVEIREGIEEAWIPRATPEECETLEIDLPADDRAAPLGSSKEQKTQTMEKRNTRKQSAAPKARGRRKRSEDNDAVKVHNGLIENKSNEKKRINTKRSRQRSDHDGTKEEVDDDIIEVISERKSDGKKRKVETVAPSIIVSPLPDLCQLEARDGGLASALRADKLLIWNAHYGTNSNIALYALRSLATGKLPHAVQFQTPFFRQEEIDGSPRQGGPPPTRFLGVFRIRNHSVESIPNALMAQYGTEFPLFDKSRDPLLPQSATVGGRKVLIRNDLTEDAAGKLFSYMFRLLYGRSVVEKCLQKTNALSQGSATFLQDTLTAFDANKIDGSPRVHNIDHP
jgi:hypothetical protein